MIKKLRIKFILTNMLLISAVLVFTFVTICLYSAKDLEKSSINAMHEIAHDENARFERIFGNAGGDKGNRSQASAFVIDLNEFTRTYIIIGFTDAGSTLTSEQEEYISGLINAVRSRADNEGVLEEYRLRYYYENNMFGKRIVLLDKQYEDESLKQLIVTSLIIGFSALAAFLLISIVVARIAVKPVQRSMEQQKRLVADVSHELKTPLAVINTNADIILSHNGETVEEQRKWLGYIKDETERMSDLVGNMLYLAKSDESDSKAVLSETDLSSAAYEASLPFESVCFENGKTLDIDIGHDITVKSDENSLKQLIVILLDNANKYSNDNGLIRLKVYAEADKAYISVFNTGEPIPKECIPHLFERFYRVDKSRSREMGGSGLGLSIAKHIIEMNEGIISVNSDEEHGTEFVCAFKLIKKKNKPEQHKPKQDGLDNVYFD